MKIVEKREFVNGFVAAVRLNDGMLIETTATCLPFSTEMRGTGNTDNKAVDWNQDKDFWGEKYMIGVSTQSGCPVKCKFCAVNDLTERQGWRNLSAQEIIDQVLLAIDETGRNPEDAKLFRILFTRMGEPSLNMEEVSKAVIALRMIFPNVRIQLSTVGLGTTLYKYMKLIGSIESLFPEEDFLELQFSVHSTDMEYRRWLQNERVADNCIIGNYGAVYHSERKRPWKVTINFSLATETPFDVDLLKNQFDPEHFFVKVSNINENCVSVANGLESLIKDRNVV